LSYKGKNLVVSWLITQLKFKLLL